MPDQAAHTTRPPTEHASERSLLALRARLRRVAIGEVLAAGLGLVLVAILAEALVDYALRLPASLRVALLLIGLAALALGVRRRLLPALRLRPKLSTLALRAERSPIAQAHQLPGVLASGSELAHQKPEPGEPGSIDWLRRAAAARADTAAAEAPLSSLVRTKTLRDNAIGTSLAVAVALSFLLFAPGIARTGLARTLLPWTDAKWPSRTELADATQATPHALGSALPIRALVTRTNRAIGETPVEVVYRIVTPRSSTPERTERLTAQETFEMSSTGKPGEAYERLLEPAAALAEPGEEAWLEYTLRTPDDRTPVRRIRLADPPRILAISAQIDPPAYAPASESAAWVHGKLDLGTAQDERALLGPVLVGSRVTIVATLSKPAQLTGDTLTTDAGAAQPEITAEGTTVVLSWTAAERSRLALALTDDLGIASADETIVRVETMSDRAPTVTVTTPERDEAVLPRAVVELAGEARDDVGLAWLELRAQAARIPDSAHGSAGASPEAEGEPAMLSRTESADIRAEARATLALEPMNLRVGDEVLVTAVAQDVYALPALAGTTLTHEEAVSPVRRLRIISEAELVEQILAELGAVRRGAVRLNEQQTELIEQNRQSRTTGTPPMHAMARDQAALTDALDRLDGAVDQLSQRAQRNALGDESLAELLERAAQSIDRAADDSEKAAADLATAAEQQRTDEAEQAEESQQRVRRSLEDLALLLDRGEDSWAVRQALDSLLEDQEQLSAETAEIGRQTVGRSSAQLTPEELTELDRIAQRQLELAERSAELLDELDTRSQDLLETDPGQAAALRAASRRGREQGVPQSLQEAAQNVQSNNTSRAGQQQQQATEQLEQMLEDLEEAQQQRDEELQRALLSLIESLEALVRTQQAELAALVRAAETAQDIRPLAPAMSTLYRNTLSVADEAGAAAETARIASLLSEAAQAQSQAIASLNAPNAALAESHENLSLTRLETALEEAQQELEDAQAREQERRKQELKKAYTDALALQAAITAETAPLVKDRLSRREQADARDLGRREQELREALRLLTESYEELTAAGVFDLAHRRLDTQLADVGAALTAARTTPTQRRMQASIESILRGLIASLEDPERDESPFSEGSSQGGEGQSGQSSQDELLPPIAELQLLRSMQEDLLDQTRMMDEFGATPDEARAMGQLQEDLAAQGDILIEKLQQQPQGQEEPLPPMPVEDGSPEVGP